MSTLNELEQLIKNRSSQGDCAQECFAALSAKQIRIVGDRPARVSVSYVQRTFGIRQQITEAAGIPTCGFEGTLKNLANLHDNDKLVFWALTAPDRVFDIFVSESTGELVGCIRVMLRDL
jgi:hypothetical protein